MGKENEGGRNSLRNPERIDILLDLFREYWKEHPDWRFFQVIQNIGLDTYCDHFYLEDSIIINLLNNVRDNK